MELEVNIAGDSLFEAFNGVNGCGRSTRGASKQRRDQINQELAELRQLLPLEQGTRERLFQLQVMSLCCCYIRKQHLLGALLNGNGQKVSATETAARNALVKHLKMQFLSASTHVSALHDNFLLVVTGQGQLLALSDNFSQDAQITTAEWMAQSDSLYDLVDARDHPALNAALTRAASTAEQHHAFVCRWRAPKLGGVTKRQAGWEGKPTLVEGRFLSGPNGQNLFAALCRPLLTPSLAIAEDQQNGDHIIRLRFGLDLSCTNAESQLAFLQCWSTSERPSASLYQFVHPSCALPLAQLHQKLLDQSAAKAVFAEQSHSPIAHCILLHLIEPSGNQFLLPSNHFHAIFVHHRQTEEIEAFFQPLSDLEAQSLAKADWLYSMPLAPKTSVKKAENCLAFSSKSRSQMAPNNSCHFLHYQPDLNNNHGHDIAEQTAFWPSDESGLLDDLPLVVLPELDDQDLDEFFRQVEQRPSVMDKEKPADNTEMESEMSKRRRME